MPGMGDLILTVTLDEVSFIAIRGLTRELQKFNERSREDTKRCPGVDPDRPFPPPPSEGVTA